MNEILTYKIRTLFGGHSGKKETQIKKGTFILQKNERGKIEIDVSFEITLMKMDDAIAVFIKNFKTKIPGECGSCLKKIEQKVLIETMEREFLFKEPKEEEDKADLFLTNIKLMEVNIEEMLRQEILLHFPIFPVCSRKCKGLCSVCGKSRNEKKCQHEKKDILVETEVKPFADLKKILP